MKSLSSDKKITKKNKITQISLLGHGALNFKRSTKGIEINLPEKLPNNVALTFKIEVKGKLITRENKGLNGVVPQKT
jgi:alpha-L-fucosidase